MPAGLVRSGDFRNGSPVTTPITFGNLITWASSPAHYGNPIPPTDPTFNSNPVTWVPSPAHFGNQIGSAEDDLLQEDGVSTFILENGSGNILLET